MNQLGLTEWVNLDNEGNVTKFRCYWCITQYLYLLLQQIYKCKGFEIPNIIQNKKYYIQYMIIKTTLTFIIKCCAKYSK